MPESPSCSDMRKQHAKSTDTANTIESRLFRERRSAEQKEGEVQRLEGELRAAEVSLQAAEAAPLVFGPLRGMAVTTLAKLGLELRIGRIKESMLPARSDLQRVRTRISEMENELRNSRGHANYLFGQMQSAGCPLP